MMDDLISRAAAIDALTDTNLKRNVDSLCDGDMNRTRRAAQRVIAQLPAVDAVRVVRCRDCLFFVVKDHWAEWNGIPILAASDCPTCTKWGGADGCMTKPDGYCFMGEPKEAENGTDHNP